jgi:hypothetical protein
MQCLNCGGQFEWAGGGQHARCTRCLSMFTNENGQLKPIVVQAPGGGFNPEFNAIFARNLGFGPPPPGAQPMPPPQMQQPHQGQQGAQHNVGAGTFDMGGGQQLHVKINGKTPENYLKDKASSMIWGWIIGAAILGIIILTFVGIGIYVAVQAKDTSTPGAAAKTAAAAAWDGKTTFACSGNDKVTLTGVTATAGVTASGNCVLALTGVNITAPVGIEASGNARVTMTGGSVSSSTSSAIATANAKVDFVGTKVTGKSKASGNGKVTGAP